MKYWRFRVRLGGGVEQDDSWAFEVGSLRVITYRVETSGVLRKKVDFVQTGEIPITNETEVKVWSKDEASGSGICDVRTGGQVKDYHVFGKVDQFATEVKVQIAAATPI